MAWGRRFMMATRVRSVQYLWAGLSICTLITRSHLRRVARSLAGNREAWLEGTGAFRNLRVLAKEYRERFIDEANARARSQRRTADFGDVSESESQEHEGSSPDNFFECLPFADSVKEDSDTRLSEDDVGLAILHRLCDEDNASRARVTVTVSSPASDALQAKVPRTPPSPAVPRPPKRGTWKSVSAKLPFS
ncbi:uncharacterized protein B0I36DRAFT_411663 [Microdochium trichocladiopsis]|uniref:Uncharacterized protein n=1 Tax=Microdochium trichocladiopsis TaxID=1682393 RepID=A0A9P9BPV1_9PEZI|nr:uncharacterized protein B0I36DRAFT_411663 [Microdochium trichocladiopsis]KAH7029622.1 hypothetical protein B0I36DRAFT_411663 [Microdochium trichocladiopsis]